MVRRMKDSGVEWIGEIPVNWDTIKIKYTSWLKGRIGWQGLKSNEYQDDGAYLITGTDFGNGKINWNSCVHISNDRFEEDKDIHIKEDDLLITKDGTIGKVAIVKNCPEKVSLNSGVLLIRNTKNIKYYNKYLFFTLLSDQFWTWYEMSQTGNSTIRHLYQEQFYNFEFALPIVEEQKKIADFLDEKVEEIDSVISKTKETIEDYKKYKQTIITDAVTKGLNPDVAMKESKLQWVDLIPKHWLERKVVHIISMPVIDGPHVSPELVDDGIPYISADAIVNGKIDFSRKRGFITKEYSEECNKRYKPQKDDILVVKLGASTGKMAIVGDETNFNIWVPLAVVRCKVDILPKYVFYSMESSYFKNEIKNGWTFGTQETLGVKTLEQLKVFVPSLEEQKEIAEYLDEKCFEIDKLIAKKEELLVDLEDYKKSFIYEYVTGKKEIE